MLLINDTETRMLTGARSIALAAGSIFEMGPKILVVKHGEYGATAFFAPKRPDGAERVAHRAFHVPALPLEEVVDPTGAGDSFAGGLLRIPGIAEGADPRSRSGMRCSTEA